MRKYMSLASISMQNVIAYRFNYVISLTASFVFILALFYLWRSVYMGQAELAGYSWNEMKMYLFITFLTNSLLSWYSETKISAKIIDGSVAVDLTKPLDFQKARLAETLGTSLFEGCVGAAIISVFILLFAGGMLPEDVAAGGLFAISLVLSLLIKFGIVYIAGLLCFWTSSGMGIAWGRAAVTNLLSGALIPLTFFPDWLKSLASFLPFQGIVFIPASIYLSHMEGIEAVKMVVLQLFWVIVLWVVGKLMWNWAVRSITIHGG